MGRELIRGTVVTPTRIVDDGVVGIEDGQIVFAGAGADLPPGLEHAARVHDASVGGYVLPGLVDLHCHGGGGVGFPDVADAMSAQIVVDEHLAHGTTSLVASLVTQSPERLLGAARRLAEVVRSGEIAGVHVEGPFLSVERRGAQDPALIQRPDPDLVRALAEACDGGLVTMTLAPEIQGNLGEHGVAQALVEVGALPSFGHTDASQGQMGRGLAEAFDALQAEGTRSRRPTVTHLFNGMRPIDHREQGPVLDALSAARRGRAVVELVGDGVHLSPNVVREVFELVGRENVALVTDAMAATGMPDGLYSLGSLEVTVVGGVARLRDGSPGGGSIAGGTAHLLDVVRTTVSGGVPLLDAVLAASTVPAQVLGRPDLGALAAGRRADVLVVDGDLRPSQVWRRGQLGRRSARLLAPGSRAVAPSRSPL